MKLRTPDLLDGLLESAFRYFQRMRICLFEFAM